MKRINKRRSTVIVLSGIVILSFVASVSITEPLHVTATKGIK